MYCNGDIDDGVGEDAVIDGWGKQSMESISKVLANL
jgi:hypothetical protein